MLIHGCPTWQQPSMYTYARMLYLALMRYSTQTRSETNAFMLPTHTVATPIQSKTTTAVTAVVGIYTLISRKPTQRLTLLEYHSAEKKAVFC